MKRPPKALLERAVKATQLYCGSDGLHIRIANRFYTRMVAATTKVADVSGMSYDDAANQITSEAKRRGCVSPTPGKDY